MSERKVAHTKVATIARVRAEYRALDRLVRRMGPADFRRRVFKSETRESWTVKDALAHITAWKWHMQRALAKERRPSGPRATTVAEANGRIYRRWHRRPAADVVADIRAAQRAVLRTLRALPDEHFTLRARSSSWPFDLVGHSTEHRVRHIETGLRPPPYHQRHA